MSAIDGVPLERWVETISRFVPKGPELSVRWRCMQWIHYLPFWRDQMGLPQSKSIKVQLTSLDKSERIDIDAPVGKHPLYDYRIPKPDWKIIDEEFAIQLGQALELSWKRCLSCATQRDSSLTYEVILAVVQNHFK